MSYLIDTNVISEVRKGPRCDRNVTEWYASIEDGEIYLSVLVFGEIRRGIDLARVRDAAKAKALETWLARVEATFAERILPIDRFVASEWGRMSALRPVSTVDGLLAATAKTHGMTLVTRNTAAVAGLGASVLNPFEAPGAYSHRPMSGIRMKEIRICIDVADIDRAVAFYRDVFDLAPGRRLGKDWVEMLGARAPIDLLGTPAGTAPLPGAQSEKRDFSRHWTPVHLDFVVSDLDAVVRRAMDAGATLDRPVQDRPYGRMANLADPFGNGLCLLEMNARGYDALLEEP